MSYHSTFDFAGFPGPNNNYLGHDNSNFEDHVPNAFDREHRTDLYQPNHQYANPHSLSANSRYLRPQEVGSTRQPYAETGVLGGIDGLSYLHNPITAPVTLDPGNQTALHPQMNQPATNLYTAGYNSPSHTFHTSMATPTSSSQLPPSITPASFSVPNQSYDFGSPFTSQTVSTTGTPDPDPFVHFMPGPATFDPVPGDTTPGTSIPPPVASSTGPQRTRGWGMRKQSRNPPASNGDIYGGGPEDGWDVALANFRVALRDVVFVERPTGKESPETALAAEITKLVKEELKRSPLRRTKAGEGTRPRNMEAYFFGILRELLPTITTTQGGLDETENKMNVHFLGRIADVLEAKLVPVNVNGTLRQSVHVLPRIGKGVLYEQTGVRAKKNKHEREKRELERSHYERMSYLFKVKNSLYYTWTRSEILGFAIVFLLWGPDAFSPGFVCAVPAEPGTANGSGQAWFS